jgi:hypothetical protein
LDADHRRMAQQPVIAPFRQYAVSWKSYRVDRESALIVPAVSVSHAVSAAAYGWYHKSQQTWPRFGGGFLRFTRAAPLDDGGAFFKNVELTSNKDSLLSGPYRSRTSLLNLNHFTITCPPSIGDKAHDGGRPALAADTGNPNNRVADHIAERAGISLRLTGEIRATAEGSKSPRRPLRLRMLRLPLRRSSTRLGLA